MRVLFLFCAVTVLASCSKPAPVPVEVTDVALEGETMGSTWHIKVKAPADKTTDVEALQGPIDTTLERINDEMSTYRPNSEISRFNTQTTSAPVPISHELAVVVQKSLDVGKATDGAYDITIDPLINLWGFDRKGRRETPPTDAEIAEAKKHTGLPLIALSGDTLTKVDPEVKINLGGIAAGYAVDVVSALLDARGFHDYMVEITGELAAKGTNAKAQPWKIGVKVPDLESHDVLAALPVANRSLTTSGTYHNFFEDKGKRYSHILDPRTGAPVTGDLVSVTVMYSDAVTADGYDTPFIILGEERARAIIAKTPGMEALFIHQDPAGGYKVTTTAGFPKIARAPSGSAP